MSIKITETITRDCCNPSKDLVNYQGERIPAFPGSMTPLFCKHCGQLWWKAHGENNGLQPISIKDWD